METRPNYLNHMVAYGLSVEHVYLHVAKVDGNFVKITDGGELVVEGDSPEIWNFVYENKNPGFTPGVYHRDSLKGRELPELHENVSGT